VIAVLGGLGAAAAFAVATLSASKGSRLVRPESFLAGVMLVGLVVTAPWVAVEGIPDGLDRGTLGWLAVSGAGNFGGLLLAYSALRIGKVALVAPIVSTEGAIAAVIAIGAGEAIGAGVGVTLCLIVVGIVLSSSRAGDEGDGGRRRDGQAIGLAVLAAGAFGASLYATGHVSDELPLVWVILPARLLAVAALAVPLAAAWRLRLTRPALPFVTLSGLCEVAGFASFAVGARHGIAVSAVLASQFAGLAAVAAFVLYGERLGRVQLAGVGAILVGVAVLSGLQA
jgi:drug/metabolite transporter (DMT)-like permease